MKTAKTDREKLVELLEKGRDLIGFSGVSSAAMARLADDLLLRGVAVPVRCKTCKHFDADEIAAQKTGTCWRCEMVMGFDDFCSYGEQKEG